MASIPRILIAVTVAACGGSSGKPQPDGPPEGTEIRVEIHRRIPFVDGDTADNDAAFVAIQDGNGPFDAVGGTDGVYTARVAGDKFGIAVGCLVNGFASIEIVQRVLADGTTYKTTCKGVPSQKLDVAIKNMPAGQRLRLRSSIGVASASTDSTVTLDVSEGSIELFGVLADSDHRVSKIFRIPAIAIPATKSVAIDAAADGVAPDLHEVTAAGTKPTDVVRTAIVRPYGTLGLDAAPGTPLGIASQYFTFPTKLQQADDLYRVTVTASATVSQSRTVKTPGALTFQLPREFTAPTPALAKTPFLHPIWTFTPTAPTLDVQTYFLDASNFTDLSVPVLRDWFVTLSRGWIGNATTVRYEFPDLTGIPGFKDVALVERERIDTNIQRDETSAAAGDGAVSTSSPARAVVGEYCGDGIQQSAFETCDPGPTTTESVDCDSDCTAVKCGDNVTNLAAGEQCDPPDGNTCDADCKAI